MPPLKPRPRSAIFALVLAAGVAGLVLGTGNVGTILSLLYSPYAAFVAVLMLVEYVVLKGTDRSALYRRGLEAAREKRREDLLALQKMEDRLVELERDLAAPPDGSPEALLAKIRKTTGELLRELRSRI